MKRVWRISHRCFFLKIPALPSTRYIAAGSPILRFTRDLFAQALPSSDTVYPRLSSLFPEKSFSSVFKAETLKVKVSRLRMELLKCAHDSDKFYAVLEQKGIPLFRAHNDDLVFLMLLNDLNNIALALEVFDWKRRHFEGDIPPHPEEYVKAIVLAGKTKNIDLAVELFTEAADKNIKTTSTYNALMTAYMHNGLAEKCHSVFRDLEMDLNCSPTIVTYNILISLCGSLMLVDHMEKIFDQIKNLNISPNSITYNSLIRGYLRAWMWGKMEQIFQMMKECSSGPNIETYLLMLRGYAISGNLEKMEETYELIKHHVDSKEIQLIRIMIDAYCKSSNPDRLRKVETLIKLIPSYDYSAWFNVSLIKFYAKEKRLEAMEVLIKEAVEHNISVSSNQIMRAIISVYFQYNAVDRLAEFIKLAERAKWRLCRSLYHCKMVMYSSEKRLKEMESVLSEMEKFNIRPCKRTFIILCKAYWMSGQRYKVEQIAGRMWKCGYGIPLVEVPL